MSGLDLCPGRVAVVTGAASGIGRAIAFQLAKSRMRVVLADVDTAALDQAASELSSGGLEGMVMACDVSVESQVEELAGVVYRHYGAVHLLVNNAGVAGASGPCWVIPAEDWAWTLAVDLWGPLHGLRAFLPRMIEAAEPGWILNIASISGLVPVPMASAYGVAKSGVIALSEALSLELRQSGANIGVTVACPAAVATSIADSLRVHAGDPEEVRRRIHDSLAAGMKPDEAAASILDAVRDGRFAVFTHDECESLARERMEVLLSGAPPRPPSW